MKQVSIRGKNTTLPSMATDAQIRKEGGIPHERTIMLKNKLGNYAIPRGSTVNVQDGDVFVDAPRRIKG